MDDDKVTYPAKNDDAFITLGEAASKASKARGKSGNCDGKTSAPSSKLIRGGLNGEGI